MKNVSEAEWSMLIEAKNELDAIRSACRCNCHEEWWSEAMMNLKGHANCGECAAALLDEADELASIEREMWNSKLGKAEEACKRLREELDGLRLIHATCMDDTAWVEREKRLRAEAEDWKVEAEVALENYCDAVAEIDRLRAEVERLRAAPMCWTCFRDHNRQAGRDEFAEPEDTYVASCTACGKDLE